MNRTVIPRGSLFLIISWFIFWLGLFNGYVNLRMGLWPFWPQNNIGQWSLEWYALWPWLCVIAATWALPKAWKKYDWNPKNSAQSPDPIQSHDSTRHDSDPLDPSYHAAPNQSEENHPILWLSISRWWPYVARLICWVGPLFVGMCLAMLVGSAMAWMSAARLASATADSYAREIQALAWRFDMPNPDGIVEVQGVLQSGTPSRQMGVWSKRYLADAHRPWQGAWLEHDSEACQEVRTSLTNWSEGSLTSFEATMQRDAWILAYQHGCANLSEVFQAQQDLYDHATFRTRAEWMFPWWFDAGRLGMLDTFSLDKTQWCQYQKAIPEVHRPAWPKHLRLSDPCAQTPSDSKQ